VSSRQVRWLALIAFAGTCTLRALGGAVEEDEERCPFGPVEMQHAVSSWSKQPLGRAACGFTWNDLHALGSFVWSSATRAFTRSPTSRLFSPVSISVVPITVS
jgi:hypothetical protein